MTKAIKLTYLIITINLLIAGTIITSMFGLKSFAKTFTTFPINLTIGLLALYLSGYFIGLKMENQINKKGRNVTLIGVIGLLIILLFGIFFGSTVGFIEEGISQINSHHTISNVVFDYYFKPFFWIILFGIIPTIITGSILGFLIKN